MKYAIYIIGVMTVLVAPAAWCQNTATFVDGATISVEKSMLAVKKDGKTLFQQEVGQESAQANIVVQKVSDKESAFWVDLAGKETFRLVGIRNENKVNLIWNQAVRWRGDLGEQAAEDVRLQDVDGDGKVEIVKGILFEGTALCGQKDAPLLFRQVYDLKKKKFVSRSLPRLVKLKTSLEAQGDFASIDTEKWRFLTASSASSSIGDDQNPLLLTAPWALVDNRPETGWSVGEGTGEGEFVSFNTLSAQWKMTAIGIEVATLEKKNKKSERVAIPPSVVVAFEDGAYRLRIPETAGKHWFVFPTAHKSECMSLILEGPAQKKSAPMALFEVSVQTEIHGEGGLAQLVKTLDDDKRGEQALHVLRSLGSDAYIELKNRWNRFSVAGKRRAVRLLADIAPVRGAHLLVSAAMSDVEFVRDDIVRGIKKSNGRGEKGLGKYLGNPSGQKFGLALELLQQLNSDAAFQVVLSEMLLARDKKRRAQLGGTLTVLASNHVERMKQVLGAAMVAYKADSLSFMFDLLKIAATEPTVAEDAALIAREVYEESLFENKYRALRIIALAKVAFSIQFVAGVTQEKNVYLRRLAARALGQFYKSEEALRGLLFLSEDNEVGIQIEALTGLLRFEQAQKQKTVQRAFNNPWPQVRALAVQNSAHLPMVKKQMVKDGLKDPHYKVVLAAMKMSEFIKDAHIDRAITNLMKASKNAAVLERAAQTAGSRCQQDDASLDALVALLRMGAEPLANSTEKIIAVSAARALGEIGSAKAVTYLKKVRQRSNLTTDKAIDGALANASKGCAHAR